MAENNEVAAPRKGKLKLILVLVLVVMLAIGLSVAGTLWFLGKDSGDDAAGADEPAAEVFLPALYVAMDRPLVTTVRNSGRQRYIQVHLAFEADAQAPLDAVQAHMPLVRNELISLLGATEFMALQGPEGRAELPQQLLAAVNQVLEAEGAEPIRRVLLRNFVIQ
ncbi:flagellar basal body-associated FliL family protein [uncultured Marinobacter sp.]|uniref:flagellar basal body-associated FliL family protein n=1 Tax=uncultured Marinobacter sp. TaxID=187379 RepID=UPI0030D7F9D8